MHWSIMNCCIGRKSAGDVGGGSGSDPDLTQENPPRLVALQPSTSFLTDKWDSASLSTCVASSRASSLSCAKNRIVAGGGSQGNLPLYLTSPAPSVRSGSEKAVVSRYQNGLRPASSLLSADTRSIYSKNSDASENDYTVCSASGQFPKVFGRRVNGDLGARDSEILSSHVLNIAARGESLALLNSESGFTVLRPATFDEELHPNRFKEFCVGVILPDDLIANSFIDRRACQVQFNGCDLRTVSDSCQTVIVDFNKGWSLFDPKLTSDAELWRTWIHVPEYASSDNIWDKMFDSTGLSKTEQMKRTVGFPYHAGFYSSYKFGAIITRIKHLAYPEIELLDRRAVKLLTVHFVGDEPNV